MSLTLGLVLTTFEPSLKSYFLKAAAQERKWSRRTEKQWNVSTRNCSLSINGNWIAPFPCHRQQFTSWDVILERLWNWNKRNQAPLNMFCLLHCKISARQTHKNTQVDVQKRGKKEEKKETVHNSRRFSYVSYLWLKEMDCILRRAGEADSRVIRALYYLGDRLISIT